MTTFHLKLLALHLFSSFLLYIFAQYSFLLIFQLIYFIVLFDFKNHFVKSIVFFAYLICFNYALALFFSFEAYLFYFIALFGIIIYLATQALSFTKKEILACGVLAVSTLVLMHYLKGFIYDIYLSLDIVDAQNFIDGEVFSLLTLLHLFIVVFILFKKNRQLFEI